MIASVSIFKLRTLYIEDDKTCAENVNYKLMAEKNRTGFLHRTIQLFLHISDFTTFFSMNSVLEHALNNE